MKKLLLFGCGAAIVALLSSGCISRPGGITSSTIPISSADSYTVIANDVVGTSWTFELFGIIPLSPVGAYAALQAAKRENGCDGLINVSANSQWMYFIIFSYYRIEVRGDAINLRQRTRR